MTMVSAHAEKLALMIKLAAVHHYGQFDKGGRPYILHVMKVMHYLRTDDDELSSIAVGHDLVEDTPVAYVDLERLGVSRRVIDGITRLTKVKGQTHEDYLRGILESFDACRVKLCDLRHNTDVRRLKGLGEKDLQRMKKYHTMHMQIKKMIAWHEESKVGHYAFPGDYFMHRDETIDKIIEEFK